MRNLRCGGCGTLNGCCASTARGMNDGTNNALARTMAAGRTSRAPGVLCDAPMVGSGERTISADPADALDTGDASPGHDGNPRWRLGRLEAAVRELGYGTPSEMVRRLEEMMHGFSAARRAEAEKSRATTCVTAKRPTASRPDR